MPCGSCTSIRTGNWIRDVTLRRALAPEGDSVIYQDRVIHVASLGIALFVYRRATESAGGEFVGRRAGAGADCAS